jgi:glucose/arabinose dehydrogenase
MVRASISTAVHVGVVLAIMMTAASEGWTQRADGAAGQLPPAAGRGGAVPIGVPRGPLGEGPWILDTAEQHKVKVSIVANGLVNPWSLAWLPDPSTPLGARGLNALITERPGRLRLLKNGVLDPTPISGVPAVKAQRLSGLMDVALHPRFAENHLVYLTYNKGRADGMIATVLARGRLDGTALTDVKDLFVAEPWWDGAGGSASRIAFGRDGMLYMTTGSGGGANVGQGQEKDIHKGKILRLRDDGSVPRDNPFVNDPSFRSEIYTWGHRNSLALIVHPVTGEMWNSENGPNGGDEVNIIKAGKNYGWPVVSMGRSYEGPWQGRFEKDGMEAPLVYWMPAMAVSGMAIYTGDRFPAWKNNLLIGAMRVGEIPNTGHLERVVFNDKTEEIRRESLLWELRQRIRDVRQGPDGLLYLLTDENPGALLKVEPIP